MLYKKNLRIVYITIASTFLFSYNVFAKEKETINIDGKTIQYSSNPITVVVKNNELKNLPVKPFVYNEYLLVPLREFFEPLGAFVEYHESTKSVYVANNDKLLIFTIDEKIVKTPQGTIEMPIETKIANGKIMIPLRFAAEQEGLLLEWDDNTRTAFVNEPPVQSIKVEDSTTTSNVEEKIIEDSTPLGNVEEKVIDVAVVTKEEEEEAWYERTYTFETEEKEDVKTQTKEDNEIITPINSNSNSLAVDMSTAILSEGDYKKTTITNVTIPNDNTDQRFVIEATEPITRVDKSLLDDNRLVLDIRNADMNVESTTKTLQANPNATEVRIGNSVESNLSTTRVVFDLKKGINFNVSFSEDRKKIYVDFKKNIIEQISFDSDSSYDYIKIKSSIKSVPNIFFATNPDRIVVDINNSQTDKHINTQTTANYTKNIKSSQFETSSTRIVADVSEQVKFEVFYEGDTSVIKLSKPTHKNFSYDSASKQIKIKKNTSNSIETNTMQYLDLYTDKKYIVTLNGDYSSQYGYGQYYVNDGLINTIDVNTKDGKTQFLINENQILAPTISEDSEYVYIKATLPKEKYERIVILDPGHGAQDSGAAANGLLEKNINVDMANKVMALIERDNIVKGYLTRTTDIKVPLNDRAQFANKIGDLFISFHNNANPSTSAHGTEVYYYKHDNDDTIGIYSKTVADIMQKQLIDELGSFDRKVKSNSFTVIKNTTVPAVLLEVGFLTNKAEASLLADENYRQRSADAIYRGILETFNIYTPKR